MIDPAGANAKWGRTLSAVTGVQSQEKLSWMSVLVENKLKIEKLGGNAIMESYGALTPAGITAIGNVSYPAPGTGNYQDPAQAKGSGDLPAKLLGLSMHIAANTVGFECLPVIPLEFPSGMLSYVETVYGGGRVEAGAENPDYIGIKGGTIGTSTFTYANLVNGQNVFLAPTNGGHSALVDGVAVHGIFMQKGRISGEPIIRVVSVGTIVGSTGVYTAGTTQNVADAITGAANGHAVVPGSSATQATLAQAKYLGAIASANLVATMNEIIGAATNSDGITNSAMTRGVSENGTERSINLKLWTTAVAAKDRDILAAVTLKTQRDLKAYGLDAEELLMKAAKNEITQAINQDILKTLFRLGVTNAAQLKGSHALDLNLLVGPATTTTKNLAAFAFSGEFKDISGTDRKADFTGVVNSVTNNAAENFATRQRMISSRLLAASGVIGNVCRYGPGDFAVTNTHVGNALKDVSGYVAAPMANTVAQANSSMHFIGTVAGINVYVDPLMTYDDTRILVGRKGTDQDSGLKFMPYDLASNVSTIDPGTMAPKILVTSSYALVPAGYYPETNYLTIALENEFKNWA